MSNKKAYILCGFANKSGIYTPWMSRVSVPCEVVRDFAADWQIPDDAAIVITHMHYRWEEVAALRRIFDSAKVPILILADGILEYRNIWEHPDLADGCIFQPIVGHKLATIGYGQTQAVESWGNIGKCETVGLPRLDSARDTIAPIQTEGPFRILIATATTPAFDEPQREAVVESLSHLHRRLQSNSQVNGRDVEVTWRLTDGLDEAIGLPADTTNKKDRPALSTVIDHVDAVITTPSTIYLECALKKRPVAILDFHNTPHYVGSAWMINSPSHLNQTLRELADPPPAKMMFQENVLQRQLRCDGHAGERMIELIEAMIAEGKSAREEDRDIKMPHRILGDELLGFSPVPSSFDLQTQYPDNPIFKNQDLEQLQLELNLAIARLKTAPVELKELQNFFEDIKTARDDLRVQLDASVARNEEIMETFRTSQKRFEESKAAHEGRLTEFQERFDELQERHQKLLKRHEESTEDFQKRYSESQKRFFESQQRFTESQQRCAETQKRTDESQQRLKEATDRYQELKKRYDDGLERNADLLRRVKELMERVQNLRSKLGIHSQGGDNAGKNQNENKSNS